MTQQSVIASRLRQYRVKARLSEDELALKAGLVGRTVRRIEAGHVKTKPHWETLLNLADALGVEPADLVLAKREEVV